MTFFWKIMENFWGSEYSIQANGDVEQNNAHDVDEGLEEAYLPPTVGFPGPAQFVNPPPAHNILPIPILNLSGLNFEYANGGFEENIYFGPTPTAELYKPLGQEPGPSRFILPGYGNITSTLQAPDHPGFYGQYGFTPAPQFSSGGTMANHGEINCMDTSGFEDLLRTQLIQQQPTGTFVQNQQPLAISTIGLDISANVGQNVTSTTIPQALTFAYNPDLGPPTGFVICQREMNGPLLEGHEYSQPQLPWMTYHFTYPKSGFNLCHEGADFYIQGTLPDISKDPTRFRVTVTAPSGQECMVTTRMDLQLQRRFICTFYPTSPGNYLIEVIKIISDGYPETTHVKGSPFQMSVTRDYMDDQLHPHVLVRVSDITPGQQAKISGICVDHATERIYIVNKRQNQIHILSMTGTHLHSFGSKGSGPGQLCKPIRIAVDHTHHRLLITDKGNNRICIFTLDGVYMNNFGRRGRRNGEFRGPWGIAVSPDGELIAVTDVKNHRIQLFGKFGEFKTTHPSGHFISPIGVCFSHNGDFLYIADNALQSIIVMSVDMTKKGTLATPQNIQKPLGLDVDPAGNIIVCEEESIRILAPNGHPLYTILATHETFNTPLDITVTQDGRLIFVDQSGTVFIY